MIERARAPVRRRPGGRSARVRAAVLQATVDVLAESGLMGLSIGQVAARAGIHGDGARVPARLPAFRLN